MSPPLAIFTAVVAKVSSVSLSGMEARPVEVEITMSGGVPDFQIVGLPSAAVRESRLRVESAIVSSQEEFPRKKIRANLAPGDLKKEGALLDLPLAVGVLTASGRLRREAVSRYLFLGELALDGSLRPVRGALAAAMTAREINAEGLVVPAGNSAEAALVPGVKVIGVSHLVEAVAFVMGDLEPAEVPAPGPPRLPEGLPDLSEVRGQALARRALEIAAAGSHNLLMVGPPGSGKTMLARRLTGILPPMTEEERLEVTHVWSVAGLLRVGESWVERRPFRSPHHGASAPSLVGGGSPHARPGEVSLAHRGVLFLDELPFFSRGVLESLRQPLEEGVVTVARMGSTLRFPASFTLVAAANPCPCGLSGTERRVCTCPAGRLEAYRSRLSGPLLDRVDLHVEVPRLTESELLSIQAAEPSAMVRARVSAARERRQNRPEEPGLLRTLDEEGRSLLRAAFLADALSARGMKRALRVARTIADLEGDPELGAVHLAEALQFRKRVWE